MWVCVRVTSNDTGWRRPTGYLRLQINFRERATNYMALLRKMTSKDKASYGSSPPCKTFHGSLPPCTKSIFAKEPLVIGLFCGKWPLKIRHSMGPCHPVPSVGEWVWICLSSRSDIHVAWWYVVCVCVCVYVCVCVCVCVHSRVCVWGGYD